MKKTSAGDTHFGRFSQLRGSIHNSFSTRFTAFALSALGLLSLGVVSAQAADSANTMLEDSPEIIIGDQQVARALGRSNVDTLAFNDDSRIRGRSDLSRLDVVDVRSTHTGSLRLTSTPRFTSRIGGRFASVTPNSNVVFYTLTELQDFVTELVSKVQAQHVAVVAMNPKTGAVLAIAGKSLTIPNIEYHAGFPAASLFKVVTAAAAVEQVGIEPNTLIPFRGGTYTLNQHNYLPNQFTDRRIMSVGEAMGRSCNPVFGHIGIKYLDGSILARYANRFGFNRSLNFEVPLPVSEAQIPGDNGLEFSRTAAGFGEVFISPVHAAAFISGVANGGLLPKPRIVDQIVTVDGITVGKSQPEALQRIVQPETAASLIEMMRYTTTVGTSRREFMRGGQPALGNIDTFGKTGTLSGANPKGLNNWFIGAAPSDNPEIAVVAITVNAAYSSKASRLGRMVMQHYFNVPTEPLSEVSRSAPRARHGSLKRSRFAKPKYRKASSSKSAGKKVSSKKGIASKTKAKKKS
jgi:peptidoglycan glycosyltransferase